MGCLYFKNYFGCFIMNENEQKFVYESNWRGYLVILLIALFSGVSVLWVYYGK